MGAVDPPSFAVQAAVRRALEEDLTPLGDITSALLPAEAWAEARFVARDPGVLAGTACAGEAFAQVDAAIAVEWAVVDGDRIGGGQVVGTVQGPLAGVLTAERTALNFLCHLSGIATLTARFVAALEGSPLAVWDTRKTTPGLRTLEKAAVRAGGGANHRGNLSDWVLLKDNHLTVLGISEAVERARRQWPARTVHVECDTFDQCVEALKAGADAILCDNMSPAEVGRCVEEAERAASGGRRCLVEVSGGINLDNVASYASTGADRISTGALTSSAPVLDVGLDIDVRA